MYVVCRWWGEEIADLPETHFAEVLREVALADDEHPDVSLKHETEWALIYFRSGLMIFQNVESGSPRHTRDIGIDEAAEMWRHLARGDLAWLESLGWSPGYG